MSVHVFIFKHYNGLIFFHFGFVLGTSRPMQNSYAKQRRNVREFDYGCSGGNNLNRNNLNSNRASVHFPLTVRCCGPKAAFTAVAAFS